MEYRNERIPGIFNYCNLRCDRCRFTSQCSAFDPGSITLPAPFASTLTERMKATNKLLQHLVNILNGSNPNGEPFFKEDCSHDKDSFLDAFNTLQSSPPKQMVRACELTMQAIMRWQKKIKHSCKSADPGHRSKSYYTNGTFPAFQSQQIEALEMLEWHCYLVPAKTRRAVYALEEAMNETGELRMICQRDADGSAKVALLGIDDCITSLLSLYSDWPEEEDNILVFLTNLSKVKALLLDEFPEAMNFIRPGFDTNAE